MAKLVTAIVLSFGAILGLVWAITGSLVPTLVDVGAPPPPPDAPTGEAPLLQEATVESPETTPSAQRPSAARLLPPDRGAYFGAYDPEILQAGGIEAWEERTGADLAIVHWYQGWGDEHTALNREWLDWVAAQGAAPMISWEPWRKPEAAFNDADQPDFRLAVIAEGRYDDYIRSWAEDAADYGHPLLVRPMHEMNGFWYPWSVTENDNTPADFVAAWRHIHAIFEEAGADNVSWVWAVNTLEGMPEELRALDLGSFYPGDDAVDWVSVVGFNYGGVRDWSSWRSAEAIFAETYDALEPFGKPVMVSEIGTVHVGGDQGAWTEDALTHLREDYPEVKAVVWFADLRGDIDFRLDASQHKAMADAFDEHWRPDIRTEQVNTP